MKIKNLLMAGVLMITASSAMAQYVDTENYLRVQASFVANKLTNTDNDPKGIALGGVYGLGVSDNLPIFVEVGAQLEWAHSANDVVVSGSNEDLKFTYMNVSIPVNGVYKYTLNDKVAFSGHAGLNFKVNFLAKEKYADYKINFLSKDDMGGRDNRNIFQLGGQIGAGVHLGQFYLGWQYQGDFMPLAKSGGDKFKFHTNYISVGLTL